MYKQKTIKSIIITAMALILLAFVPAISLGAPGDFEIKDGVLIKYKGTAKEVTIPNTLQVLVMRHFVIQP